jgi:ribosomal protein L7/L12
MNTKAREFIKNMCSHQSKEELIEVIMNLIDDESNEIPDRKESRKTWWDGAVELIHKGEKLKCVKHICTHTGVGLRSSKAQVDSMQLMHERGELIKGDYMMS